MKNIKIIGSLLLLFTALTFTSCENEPLDPELNLDDFGNNNPTAVFKADFSGSTWTATQSTAVISGNLIQIVGGKSNGESFGFLINANAVGTYPANQNILAFTPAGSEFGYWSVNPDNETENTGSITITEINTTNKTISGTFSFKGYWSDIDQTSILPVQFTNGVFNNIPYVNQSETNDSFYAKVDGTEFVDVDILTAEIQIESQDFISIAAQDANLNAITVSVRSNLSTGTYNITGNVGTDLVQAIYDFNDADNQAVSGSVTITSKTADRIKGTFSFVTDGSPTYNVTQGSFDVAY
jgi:hypothetical protein